MSLLDQWLNNPEASATITVALIAGLWALAQYRPITRDRRRETYDAMTRHYAELRPARQEVIPGFPLLVTVAREQLLGEAQRILTSSACSLSDREQAVSGAW